MSNINDFVIENGVLTKYLGKDSEVVIPNSVKKIAAKAFCTRNTFKNITIPDTVGEIEEYAFSFCPPIECVTIKSAGIKIPSKAFYLTPVIEFVLPEGFLATEENRSVSFLPYVKTLSNKEAAYIWLYHGDKWIAKVQQERGNVREIAKEMLLLVKNVDIITPKRMTRLAGFLEWASSDITAEIAKAFCEMVFEKDEKLYQKFEKLDIVQELLKGQNIEPEEPIEAYVEEMLQKKPLHPDANVFTKGIPYAGKKTLCSPRLLNALVSEYLYKVETYRNPNCNFLLLEIPQNVKLDALISKDADVISASLDRLELSQALEKLVYRMKSYRQWMYAYARFATNESIERLTQSAPYGSSSEKKYWRDNLEVALLISEEKSAVDYLEKKGRLEQYAALRGMSLQDYRDAHSIPDFGFDSTGAKKYNVDGNEFEVRIADNFTLIITDAKTGKIVKSISKKTAEGAKAAEDFAALKKSIDEFYKKRIEYAKKIYITGEKISEQNWNSTYMKNPLFCPLVESLIWQDDNGIFFDVSQGVCRDVAGAKFEPAGAVRIAHVLDMTGEQIDSWQKCIINAKKTLLIEQVWEPISVDEHVIDIAHRYDGCVITKQERNELKKLLKSKAIDVRSEEQTGEFDHRAGKYVYDNRGTMLLGSCFKIKYEVNEDNGDTTLGVASSKLRGDEITREFNTIIFELDRIIVKSLIAKDNVEALTDDILKTFTCAQISMFLDNALKSDSTHCTARLMDYKNAHFETSDPFDMFVLE